ncbi:sulfatase [bacterium]|nr:sulfatase [bacterium]
MATRTTCFWLLVLGAGLGLVESITGYFGFRLSTTINETILFFLFNILVETIVVLVIWSVSQGIIRMIGLIHKCKAVQLFWPFLCVYVLYGAATLATQVRDSFSYQDSKNIGTVCSSQKENIILIIVDTLRQDRLGCYGNPDIYTPALDRFSRKAHLFTQAVCQIPITAPSHQSLFSGLYPFEHGGRYNGMACRPDCALVAEILREQGYATAAFVSSAAVDGDVSGLSRGFDYYDDRFFFYNYDQRYIQSMPVRLLASLFGWRTSEIRAGELNKRIKWYLPEIAAQQPFFLWLHYYDPHMPYQPQRPYDRLYDQGYSGQYRGDFQTILDIHMGDLIVSHDDMVHISALYDGEVTEVDRSLEDLFRTLSILPDRVMDRTSIIFASDHGESLTEHNYYFFHAEKLTDPSLRVPLLLRFPEQASGPLFCSRLVMLLDLYATLLDRAGIQAEPTRNSHNLVSLLSCMENAGDSDRIALSENGDRFFLSGGNHDLHLDQKSFSLRTESRKYIRHPGGEEEYFDLLEDPRELHNSMNTDQTIEQYRTLMSTLEPSLRLVVFEANKPSAEAIRQLQALGYIHE